MNDVGAIETALDTIPKGLSRDRARISTIWQSTIYWRFVYRFYR